MTRYDWPRAPFSRDDPTGRAVHSARVRPANTPAMTAVTDPAPAPRAKRAAPARRTRRVAARTLGDTPLPTGNNLWLPIGPSVTVNGQASGDPNVAGRVRDLQVHPVGGQRVYAASASGGCWFSPDAGETWRPLDDFVSSDRLSVGEIASALACGSVHVIWGAAADGSQDEVWLGTGEPTMYQGGPGGAFNPGLPGGNLRGIGLLHATGPATGGAWDVETAAANGDGNAPDSLRGHATYRVTGDPGDPSQLVAGTTNGLYLKPSGGTWGKAATWPMSGITHPIDVVMNRLTGPDRVRIWVAAASALYMAEAAVSPGTPIDPATLSFTSIAVPGVLVPPYGRSRMTLAMSSDGATLYLLGQRPPRLAEAPRKVPAAFLWSVTALESPPIVSGIEGVPPDMFGKQADYDMCVAVHPGHPTRVYVGGCFVATGGTYNAAVYRLEVTGATAAPTLVGTGIHADDHVIRIGPADAHAPKRAVWVGCDGGLFRSDQDGDDGTFLARNNGLAVLQPGYVASHATNAGIVAAGFQDNGTAVRVGDTVWEEKFKGDGGGVIYDPTGASRYFRQYIHADWEADDGGLRPVLRRGAWLTAKATQLSQQTSETIEDSAAAFYSGADAAIHGGLTHLAFGTDRVWYSSDWSRTWVTLPSAKDPRGNDNPDLDQDVLHPGQPGTYSDEVGSTECCNKPYEGSFTQGISTEADGILAVKFAATSDATNHTLRALALYAKSLVWLTGTRAVAGSGAFTWAPIPTAGSAQLQAFRGANNATETALVHDAKPLTFMPAVGLVSDLAVHDPARGDIGSVYVTTIGAPGFPAGAASGDVDTLYFFDGKATWYPCGVRRAAPNTSWTTTQVTAPALGVVVDPDDRGSVYVATSVGVLKGTLTIGDDGAGNATYTWAWAQFVNGLPEAAVQDLSIHSYSGVKLLRAALASRGVWETDLANPAAPESTYLRLYPSDTRRRVPTPLAGPTSAGEQTMPTWDNSPDIVVDLTGTVRTSPPTESELYKMAKNQIAGFTGKALIQSRHPVVHVLVHRRAASVAAGIDVRVALMTHEVSGSDPVPLGSVWPALVAAASATTQPASLPDGWRPAGATLWQNLAGPLDPRMPRAVSFPVDLSGESDGAVFALVAVVLSASATEKITADDLKVVATATTVSTVAGLVQNTAHVAAKSIELDTPF
jgi:hypothetical protein